MMAARLNTTSQLQLADLLNGIASVPARSNVASGGMTLDSRKVKPGDLFIATGGTRHHGALFIDQAVQQGAAAIVVEPSEGVTLPEGPLMIDGRSVPVIVVENLRQHAGS